MADFFFAKAPNTMFVRRKISKKFNYGAHTETKRGSSSMQGKGGGQDATSTNSFWSVLPLGNGFGECEDGSCWRTGRVPAQSARRRNSTLAPIPR